MVWFSPKTHEMTVSPHSTQKEADVDSSAVTCPMVGSSASEDWAVSPMLGCCMWWTSWPCFTSICNLQILLSLSLSLFFFFFTNGRFVATLGQAGLLAPFSQQPLLPSCLCHISVILAVSDTLLIITIFVTWSVIFVLLQLTEVSDDG